MERYEGQDLGQHPRITILGSCKVGNFVNIVPLLKLLRKKYKDATIDYWGSEVTASFEYAMCKKLSAEKNSLIDWRYSWDSNDINKCHNMAKIIDDRGKPDLLINCDGFNPFTQVLASLLNPKWVAGAALDKSGRKLLEWGTKGENLFLQDNDWNSREFKKRYDFLKTQHISELFCQIAFIKPDISDLEKIDLPSTVPSFDVPDILIHCTSTRQAKIWHFEYWKEVISWCRSKKYSVGIIGTLSSPQNKYHGAMIEDQLINYFSGSANSWRLQDLRGKTSLIELAGACKLAKALITVDSGPLHIGSAVGANVIAIVGNDKDGDGASPIRVWMPLSKKVIRTKSSNKCLLCSNNKFKNDECLIPDHKCMEGVRSDEVIKYLNNIVENA